MKKAKRKGLKIVAAALCLCLIVAAVGVLLGNRMGPATTVFAAVSQPVQDAGQFLRQNAAHIYGQAVEHESLLREIEALRSELAAVKTENREADAALRENERLRKLLGLRETRSDFTLEAARVLLRQSSNWGRGATLSKGTDHGVAAGNCVIDANGALVGLVSEVSARSCRVQLITDAALQLGGEVAAREAVGVLEGDLALMADSRLRLTNLDKDCGAERGDEVLTFASEGVYPHGLLVGTVEEVTLDASGMHRTATILPAAKLDELYQVFVITAFISEN